MWSCRDCGGGLGVVREGRLYLSLWVAVEVRVRVCCLHCGAWQTWYAPSAAGQERLVEVKSLG